MFTEIRDQILHKESKPTFPAPSVQETRYGAIFTTGVVTGLAGYYAWQRWGPEIAAAAKTVLEDTRNRMAMVSPDQWITQFRGAPEPEQTQNKQQTPGGQELDAAIGTHA